MDVRRTGGGRAEPVYDWLAYYAEFDPARLAAVDLASGRRYTYGSLDERVTRLATALMQSHGVGRGDRVAYLAQDSVDHFATLFACWKLGAIFVPLNRRLSPRELARIVVHADPAVIVHDAEFAPLLAGSPDGRAPRIRRGGPDCGFESLIAAHEPRVRMHDVDFDTVNLLIYTSGTTGRPKGVIQDHRMTQNIVQHAAIHARVRAHSRTLTYAPLFHSAGLNAATMPQFHYGGAVFVMQRFEPRECLAHLQDPELGITHTVGVPTTYIALAELPEFAAARFPALEVAGVGGAPVPHHLLEAWERKGVLLSQSYGLTEAFGVSFCPPEQAHDRIGSAGHSLLNVEVRIADAGDAPLPRGQVGEIQVRGPGVTPGYWRDPEATAAAFTADGWFRTGDAGRLTADGTLYVVDRIKDMYISGGENVYPAEVEDAIDTLDEVSQSAVIGVPDARWGETGVALVQRRPGCALTEAQVLERCRERLARYKVPRAVQFVDALPTSPQGKVLKHVLRERYGSLPPDALQGDGCAA